jgi:CRP-like cAMP-binding protein
MMTNDLIAALPAADRRHLLTICEPMSLAAALTLSGHRDAAKFLLFPSSGAVALLGQAHGHPALAVSLVGHEGVIGAHLVLGIPQAPMAARVLYAGEAWRVSRQDFGHALNDSGMLRRKLMQYLVSQTDQLARAVACLCFHSIPQRLARWLLMCDDRSQAHHFRVTHEVLAVMLGVRRVSVTLAALELQGQGFIDYHRGEFTVLDHAALCTASCACYGEDLRARKVFKLRR